jgi:predicted site-specific integrase-resolvase
MHEKRKFIPSREATLITGLKPAILRKLANEQKIYCYRTYSGHRMYSKEGMEQFCNTNFFNVKIRQDFKDNYIYARVSTQKQLDDLARQVEFLQKHVGDRIDAFRTVKDIGSGINWKRKNFNKLLDESIHGKVEEIVI